MRDSGRKGTLKAIGCSCYNVVAVVGLEHCDDMMT
jgi:hypothetical protein